MEPKTFREAYGVLQRHSEALREQTEPNIDDLLSIVTESVAAYKVCKERIDAVEKALKEALTDVGEPGARASGAGTEGSETGPQAITPRRPSPRPAPEATGGRAFDSIEDDIPF